MAIKFFELSEELLSTKIISRLSYFCSSIDLKQLIKNSAPFNTGMIMEISGLNKTYKSIHA